MKGSKMNDMYDVTYTAYEKGTNYIVSEGTMPVRTSSAYMAEQTVKSMFSSTELIIRTVRKVN
jgi:hypothetical protein